MYTLRYAWYWISYRVLQAIVFKQDWRDIRKSTTKTKQFFLSNYKNNYVCMKNWKKKTGRKWLVCYLEGGRWVLQSRTSWMKNETKGGGGLDRAVLNWWRNLRRGGEVARWIHYPHLDYWSYTSVIIVLHVAWPPSPPLLPLSATTTTSPDYFFLNGHTTHVGYISDRQFWIWWGSFEFHNDV